MSNLTFIGSTYERYIQAWPDCNGFEYPISVDPTPDQLTCLAFSLPSNFSSPSVDSIANGPLASYMSFTNTSAACGGSDLISRLTTVYNRTIRVMFTVGLTYNKDENVAAQPHFVEGVYSQFMLNAANSNVSSPNFLNENGVKARRGGPGTAVCWISWISTTTQAKGQYVLAYKNPVCGSKAPKIGFLETLENFAISYFFEQPQFYHGMENTSVFAAAYNIDISAVTYVSISDSKFDVIVTSDSGAQSDENSCVYKYRLADRDVIVRNMTLISYDFGSLPVSNLTTPADGCITAFNAVNHLSEFVFTNSSAASVSSTTAIVLPHLQLFHSNHNYFDNPPTSTTVSTLSSSLSPLRRPLLAFSLLVPRLSFATTTAAVPTGYVTPTGYAVPTAYGGPTDYELQLTPTFTREHLLKKLESFRLILALALAF
ncbi:hypothetical protein BCR33DRAFT_784996 [Rhizoclosmatium globosum]|uniref:Uncharacterized protein n=1 Tax=Rhizoclosmatium globosum TaxID=329046 RepID=A0A1Y2CBL5_9FUNG|nr:hypothetical protein BCR33DRAFT_784996 [Rhizoclosmatium globosum]|eukprot:ORY44287.1 hypothetical protein BCR33DRAFT_784996 [Rhizoclosmatium globosum]